MLDRLLDTRPLLRRGLTRIPGELRSTIVGGSEFWNNIFKGIKKKLLNEILTWDWNR